MLLQGARRWCVRHTAAREGQNGGVGIVIRNGDTQAEANDRTDLLGLDSKFRRKAMLWWPNGRPERVLMVKKPGNVAANSMFIIIAAWCAPAWRSADWDIVSDKIARHNSSLNALQGHNAPARELRNSHPLAFAYVTSRVTASCWCLSNFQCLLCSMLAHASHHLLECSTSDAV